MLKAEPLSNVGALKRATGGFRSENVQQASHKAAPRRYCRMVTALPIEDAPLPPVPNSIAGIRALLPNSRRAEFDAELLAAADQDTLDALRAFRNRWWILAAFETDPSLRNIPEETNFFPSPIAR